MTGFIPANLPGLLKEHPPTNSIKRFDENKLNHILSLFHSIPAFAEDLMEDDFVPLYTPLLNKQIKSYIAYLVYLEKQGVIECNNYYKERQSKRYRLTKAYQAQQTPISLDPKLSIHRCKLSTRKRRKYNYLIKHFDGLEIDKEAAYKFINIDRALKEDNPRLIDYKPDKNGVYKAVSPVNQFNIAAATIEAISERRFSWSIDDNVHRFHSNLTNMRSQLRNCITWKGERLVSVDLKNSQPYLVNKLLNNQFWSNEETGELNFTQLPGRLKQSILQSIEAYQATTPNSITINAYIMLPISSINQYQTEFQEYTKITSTGKFYESLAIAVNGRYQENEREDIKRNVLTVLYSKNSYNPTWKKAFTAAFPCISELFRMFKYKEHTLLAIMLQNIESHLFIDVIAKEMSKHAPKAPVFTIHDSVVTTDAYTDQLYQLMTEKLTQLVGTPPMLKIEPWEIARIQFKDGSLLADRG